MQTEFTSNQPMKSKAASSTSEHSSSMGRYSLASVAQFFSMMIQSLLKKLRFPSQAPVTSSKSEIGRANPSESILKLLRQLSTITGLWLVAAYWLAWPETRFAPGIVEYAIETPVENATPGFLDKVHVHLGQKVKRGDLLVQLSNTSLQSEIRELELLMQQSEIRCRQNQRKGDAVALQDEEAKRTSLMKSLGNKRRQSQSLQVVAPCDGLIVQSDFEGQQGCFIEPGKILMTLADENSKRLRLSIAKEDFDTFYDHYDATVVVDIPEKHLMIGCLSRFELPIVQNAGVVDSYAERDVQEKMILPNRTKGNTQPDEGLRFTALVDLHPEESLKLTAGQRAMIRYRAFHKSLAAVLANQYWQWAN